MRLPTEIRRVLPPDAATTWERIADLVPPVAYLVGGTALAVHLGHRISRDLDFFLEQPVDVGGLRAGLEQRGPFHVTDLVDTQGRQTLNGVFGATKLQFLEATSQRVLEPTTQVLGVRVAGPGDLLATKLKVLLDRPELRDYFDLWSLETHAGRRVEEGLSLAVLKYSPQVPDEFMLRVVRALASYDDVAEDPSLPAAKHEVESYWRGRLPEIVASLDRSG
jgi:predicted nucleotidyltransferase component of viral defense system